MCTCITYENGDFYFGRNLDLESSFGEKVVVTPRNHPFHWREMEREEGPHFAMIGMGAVAGDTPLYAEAVNEKGLAMAGLNFPGNACYSPRAEEGRYNVATFELIPWLLGTCASVSQVEELLHKANIRDTAFAPQMPPAPLHWMIADQERCLVAEMVAEGLKLYDNPAGVLTNNPPFPYHQMNLANYLNVTAAHPDSRFSAGLDLAPYAEGMGGLGLPGDASSPSRFVKAAFLKWNSAGEKEEGANVSQFFHILDNVSMVRGSVVTASGAYDITTYSCCVNTRTGVYYYKTYDNSRIRAVDLHREDLEGSALAVYELEDKPEIRYQN